MVFVVQEFVGAYEIARMLGVSRQRVQQLINRPDFPAPYIVLKMGKIWRSESVAHWASELGREIHDDEGDQSCDTES